MNRSGQSSATDERDPASAFLTASQVAKLATAAAEPEQPGSLFRAIDQVSAETLRPALLTANVFDLAAMAVERIYTSDDRAYPLGGRKPKRDTAWGRHVLIDQRVYVGAGENAIREAFPDYELILSLGLRSVVNVPVVFAARCLGTLNFLWRSPTVAEQNVAVARLLALIAMPAFHLKPG
jgi:hypothetical protein